MKINFKQSAFLLFVLIFIFLEIGFVFADSQGVYVLKLNEENILRPELQPFNSAGEVEIQKGQTVYLDKSVSGKDGTNSIGLVENVKITKNGNGVIVEFKDKGLLKVTLEDLKQYDYNNLKSSSKFSFDSKGKLIGLDVETLGQKTFNLNGMIYDVSEGTHLTSEVEKETFIKLIKAGSFDFYFEKDGKKQIISNVKEGGSFTIDKEGKLIKFNFEVSKDTEFNFKGWKYVLKSGSKVKYDFSVDKNKIDITVLEGKIEEPQKQDGADGELVSVFKNENGDFILSNGNLIGVTSGDNLLYFKDGNFYIKDKNYVLKDSEGKTDFSINNVDGKDILLIFDRNKLESLNDKDYIFMVNENGKNKLILNSPSGKGVSAFFSETNNYGFLINSDRTAAVQAISGKIFIEQPDSGKIPGIKISGESMATIDKKSFSISGGDIYYDPNKLTDGDFSFGDSLTIVKVSIVDNNENNLKNYDLYTNYYNQFAAVTQADFRNSLEFYRSDEDFYVSNTIAFNYLTPEAQELYDLLDPGTQEQLSAAYIQSGDLNIAGLQQKVMDLVFEPKIVFDELTIEEFTRKTGINVYGSQYLNENRLRNLMAVYQELPVEVVGDVHNIYISSSGGGGLADGSGIHLSANQLDSWDMQGINGMWGMDIGTYYHESFHRHHFNLGDDFTSEWSSLNRYNGGLSYFQYGSNGYAWGYGSKSTYEDVASFGDFIHYPEYWTSLVSDSNQYSSVYRAKLALLEKYNFISYNQYRTIFKEAGLEYGPYSVQKYLDAGKR